MGNAYKDKDDSALIPLQNRCALMRKLIQQRQQNILGKSANIQKCLEEFEKVEL
jgi:hypothetical protein